MLRTHKTFRQLIELCLAVFLTAVCLCACSARTTQITKLNLYTKEVSSNPMVYMHLEWYNAENLTADALEVSFRGNFTDKYQDEEQVVIRLLCPEGVSKAQTGIVDDHEMKFLLDGETYEAELTKVTYSDGSVYIPEQTETRTAAVNTMINSPFPALLEEMNVYCQYEGDRNRDINVSWTNDSDQPLKGVIFKVTGWNLDKTVCKDSNGEDAAAYIPSFPENGISPGEKSPDYHFDLSWYSYSWIENARAYDVSIWRAVTQDGTVYENSSDSNKVSAVLLGKKGYAFSDSTDSAPVKKLISNLEKAFSDYDLPFENPKIFIRKKDYCLLRYDDLDVRVELNQDGSISKGTASFVYYFKRSLISDETEKQKILDTCASLRLSVYPAVLTDIPRDEVVRKIEEFNNNDLEYIDFSDTSYDTFEESTLLYDEFKFYYVCMVEACGKNFDYYPSVDLFFAYDTIYDSEKGHTVPHRPQ